ncbi:MULTISPECIES: efflux RND transporter permease subunit [Bradyrhizobium]|uniref:ACR family transporter n=3 Tax=Bradyrhizobium TaxID=374 RepID=A0A410VIE6_9BRAD|nr:MULTISPECIES: efflux RND transporter permease subunit [Bradyrhizobium]MCG2628229.1 efflux RND transporter permease subunit [Bradyrhizobium zhengyangense]MCG2643348.1 efflux RND transporter permease subunit [Bradyrhizobium zhengyangense]MCG2670338.1 efflux RND transporter permease subunit [Bradyrhizobium zhengyangense]MDN4985927.1 efflux RND transporter permease subunit [Bradyrhizobium sp. WYCCWR 13022]MDN5002693.1 efflux RND transporter permease subunit [Bradyrhizobium sp. WYCCWR 12677]
MTSFNLSEWALKHRSFVWFLMIASAIAGLLAYRSLGREEDPPFTIKTMVIQQQWPGATVDDMLNQVTDRIEKEVKQIGAVDYVKSYTTPGQTTILVNLKDTTKPKDVPWLFYEVRKHVQDIQYTLPSGVGAASFNDEFGDVFGNIYAFTSDGLSPRQLRDYVERVRSELLTVPSIGKITVIGAQDEVIYLDISTRKLAALGLNMQSLIKTLQNQNTVQPSGVVQAGPEQVSLRVSGQFASEEALRSTNLRIDNRFLPLSDVATITRGYRDPPDPLFRVDGKPAIGLGIAMMASSNVLQFGEALRAKMRDILATLPVGVELHLVSDQPKIVEQAVGGFTEALVEAIAIVLVVSLISLGVRAGLVVSFSIPLVLAVVFVIMQYFGVTLQRISLGALIIALGLLVDDAMITVEMMVHRLERGDNLYNAVTFAYTSTAFPMLTGTLVTVAGFIPIGFNGSSAGEYTYTLFLVIAASLLTSWVVAVLFAPLIGVMVLPKTMKHHDHIGVGRLSRYFVVLLEAAMRFRWVTIGGSLGLLAVAIVGMGFVQQQFFPSSDRSELLVDLTLPQGSTILETKKQIDQFEKGLASDPDVESWSSYVGQGAIRFYLPLDQQMAFNYFGQVVVVAKSLEARNRIESRLRKTAADQFIGIDVFIHPLDLGPPVGRPLQYRLSGPDIQQLRAKALEIAKIMSDNPHLDPPTFDWNEPGKVVQVEIAQDKARQLGLDSVDVASILNGLVGGTSITQMRDSIYQVNIVGRAANDERSRIETLQSLQIPTGNGQVVPLLSFATLRYDLEQPIIWRRDRVPTITIRGTIHDGTQPATVVQQLAPAIETFAANLPASMKIATGGAVEESSKGQGPIVAVVPVMLLAMAFFIMVQLQSFAKLFLVVSVAPLGLIGVVFALLVSGKPMGFVAILGTLALIGIIIRNSIILMAQIDEMLDEGHDQWSAVVLATQHRMRPILLTAAAASLGMLPIAPQVFWGPMALSMIGGIMAATFLTLFFLPALYIAWFRVEAPLKDSSSRQEEPSRLARASSP